MNLLGFACLVYWEVKDYLSSLPDIWASINGLKFYLQQSGYTEAQKKYCNVWMHDHYATNVICSCEGCTIPFAFISIAGLLHDNEVDDWGNIYH